MISLARHAKRCEHLITARLGVLHDLRIKIAAVAVHADQQRTESLDLELPERLGIQVVQIDILDRLDPRRLERSRAADDRKVDAAEIGKRLLGCRE
jgi:hypothetical protein